MNVQASARLQALEGWQKYGEPAREHYADLPYHNWGHAVHVAEQVLVIGDRLASRHLYPDLGLLAVAAAWHDAGYAEDHRAHHMVTKEAYSARLAEQFLIDHGASEDYVARVGRAIHGTTHGVPRKGIEMLLLHRADIADIGAPYPTFAQHSYYLLQEARMGKPDVTLDQYVERTALFIGVIIAESVEKVLALLGEPTEGPDSFPVVALANVTQLRQETEASLAQYTHAA